MLNGRMEEWKGGRGGRLPGASIPPFLHSSARPFRERCAFTLIEILIALSILTFAFSIIFMTFSSTLNAWQRGNDLLEEMHHGDFVMDQMVSALRSAAFFPSAPSKYGFWLKTHNKEYPADELSWVSSGTAFMPPNAPLANGLHRLMITIEENPDGDPSVAVRAFPYMKDEIEKGDVEPWFVSSRVKGIKCRVWDEEQEDWTEKWDGPDTNKIPSIVEITLYMDPVEKYGPAVKIQRLVEIPIAPAVTGAVVVTKSGETVGTNKVPTKAQAGTNAAPAGAAPNQHSAPSAMEGAGNGVLIKVAK